MIYVWIILGMFAASGLLQAGNTISLHRRMILLEREQSRLATRAETARYTGELERATGMDLAGLPPHWRTIIQLVREARR